MSKKIVAQGIPTIDVALLVARAKEGEEIIEIAVDTSSQVAVEAQSETTEAIKLIKLGRVLSQKPQEVTVTGYQLTITDNVFTPRLVLWLQGGTITGSGKNITYMPPVSGSKDKGKIFEIDTYSAVYDEAGNLVNYEKITYPNCKGNPVPLSVQDGTFRTPEYTITSAPKKGESPYTLSYVDELPDFTDAEIEGEENTGSEVSSYSLPRKNDDGTELMV